MNKKIFSPAELMMVNQINITFIRLLMHSKFDIIDMKVSFNAIVRKTTYTALNDCFIFNNLDKFKYFYECNADIFVTITDLMRDQKLLDPNNITVLQSENNTCDRLISAINAMYYNHCPSIEQSKFLSNNIVSNRNSSMINFLYLSWKNISYSPMKTVCKKALIKENMEYKVSIFILLSLRANPRKNNFMAQNFAMLKAMKAFHSLTLSITGKNVIYKDIVFTGYDCENLLILKYLSNNLNYKNSFIVLEND